jgi:hypothetical protein
MCVHVLKPCIGGRQGTGQCVEVHHHMMLLILRVLCTCLHSLSAHVVQERGSKMAEVLMEFQHNTKSISSC